MGGFFAELKRRQMFRVAAAYAVVAWLLLQVVNNVAPVLDLPVWVARAFLLALVIGFPIALLFVWMRDLGSADASAPKPATTKLDYVLAGGLAVVIALLLYQQLAPSRDGGAMQQPSVAGSPSQPAGISIAVLPFANVSGDASRDFFSDGMTDEISGALAKIADLRVIARSSAFQFKGQSQDVRAVGQALGATHLIDGSVRQAGNRVRITAQLVRAGDGVQLWSENYDRELTDIFAIQEDIARAIAGALRVPLGLAQGESIVSNRTADIESYQEYLRARALFRARDLTPAIASLESIVARDPMYASAWALLSVAHAFASNRDPKFFSSSVADAQSIYKTAYEKARMAAEQAVRLDPDNPDSLRAQGFSEFLRGNRARGEDLLRQALASDATDPELLDGLSQFLWLTGRLTEALELREQLRALEPFVPTFKIIDAVMTLAKGPDENAIHFLEGTNSPDAYMNYLRSTGIAQGYAELGRYDEAAEALLAMPSNLVSRASIEQAARLLHSAGTRTERPESLPEMEGLLRFVYAHVGAPERAIEFWERRLEIGAWVYFVDWSPAFAPLRKTQRFKTYVRDTGLVDYWRARGWPDLCRPVGADDFECE